MSERTAAALGGAAVAIIAFCLSASPASAAGTVYDDGFNVAAGGNLFNGTLTGTENQGLGDPVMPALTSGNNNTAIGKQALFDDTSGFDNVAIGQSALFSNQTGGRNEALGTSTLQHNTTGSYNVASGNSALFQNKTGDENVATGLDALLNSTGSRNVAIGPSAGQNLTGGSDNVDIANQGVAGETRTIRIGTQGTQSAAFLAGVWNTTIGGPTKAVVVNKHGRLGTAPSPAAPLNSQARTISRLRSQVRQQGAEIARLRELVRGRTG